ncbi:heavy-metal-associated domain-containing protein [Paenibacillus frigoriresistens]|uniref:heavy-metal-associated domain-containing protein n=1 Tax=Paenibacillus alginolyticus TaxID=59839 RepID=UPI001565FB46|nr:heavy-metal-associated domain-containing protein [Paenibacillus frigoriresistens]NRF95219.1 heavy-metal-associated domain-containing protein [Paenibacillus frigoriresistens]
MVTSTLVIQGMTNQDDSNKVSRALQQIWGINKVEVYLDRKEAIFSYDEKAATFDDFQQAVLELGFAVKTKDGFRSRSLHEWQLEHREGEASDAPNL